MSACESRREGPAADTTTAATPVVPAVLDALDQTLIPGSQNAELEALLQQARPAFAAHLELARKIQGSLGPR